METTIPDLNTLKQFAAATLVQLEEKADDKHASVLALSGELGAGKTAFTKLLAEVLGVTESVPSPTFVIAKFYDIQGHPKYQRLIHADMYRINTPDELRPLGWEQLLGDPTNLIVVEWPERINGHILEHATRLHFTAIDETTRIIRA